MVNKDFGWIGNSKGDKRAINVRFPDKIDKSILIGLGLVEVGLVLLYPKNIAKYIISCALVGTGVSLALHEAFYRGANQFWKAETEAHIDLGNLEGPIENYIF